jgi:hypothetical protein
LGLHSYHYSRKLLKDDPPFESLIFAAIRKSDSDNMERLQLAFPELVREMQARYNGPGGVIPEDGYVNLDLLSEQVHRMFYPEEYNAKRT